MAGRCARSWGQCSMIGMCSGPTVRGKCKCTCPALVLLVFATRCSRPASSSCPRLLSPPAVSPLASPCVRVRSHARALPSFLGIQLSRSRALALIRPGMRAGIRAAMRPQFHVTRLSVHVFAPLARAHTWAAPTNECRRLHDHQNLQGRGQQLVRLSQAMCSALQAVHEAHWTGVEQCKKRIRCRAGQEAH
jgi:hypothetical protein